MLEPYVEVEDDGGDVLPAGVTSGRGGLGQPEEEQVHEVLPALVTEQLLGQGTGVGGPALGVRHVVLDVKGSVFGLILHQALAGLYGKILRRVLLDRPRHSLVHASSHLPNASGKPIRKYAAISTYSRFFFTLAKKLKAKKTQATKKLKHFFSQKLKLKEDFSKILAKKTQF